MVGGLKPKWKLFMVCQEDLTVLTRKGEWGTESRASQ